MAPASFSIKEVTEGQRGWDCCEWQDHLPAESGLRLACSISSTKILVVSPRFISAMVLLQWPFTWQVTLLSKGSRPGSEPFGSWANGLPGKLTCRLPGHWDSTEPASWGCPGTPLLHERRRVVILHAFIKRTESRRGWNGFMLAQKIRD